MSETRIPQCSEWIDGAQILDRVSAVLRKYVHLSDQQARVVTVWIAHTHGAKAASTTPYLAITSAAKQSGKTRLLEVLELLVANPWFTGRVTAACLVRKIDKVSPTLLLDESDAAFRGDKDYSEVLRGLLNTGFYEDGVASCCVGQGAALSYKDFKTYCPKAIAGIGQLPDTVADRSIPIRLERKKPGEVVARFRRHKAKTELKELKIRLATWVSSIADCLKEAEPDLPEELSDRQQDGIEPLLAIVDAAGRDWPEALRSAAVAIFRSQAADDQNVSVQLLADIRSIVDTIEDDKVGSSDLVERLKQIETSPWADWSKGKGLTPNGLARLLKPFGIAPKGTLRFEDKTAKGYLLGDFSDAFDRYLRPQLSEILPSTVTKSPAASSLIETESPDCHKSFDVTVKKNAPHPHESSTVTDVTLANTPRPSDERKGADYVLPRCPTCGSYALYRLEGGETLCQTCGNQSASCKIGQRPASRAFPPLEN